MGGIVTSAYAAMLDRQLAGLSILIAGAARLVAELRQEQKAEEALLERRTAEDAQRAAARAEKQAQ